MTFEVLGTDHRFQGGDPGLRCLVESFLGRTYIAGPIQLIAEEWDLQWGISVAQQLADEPDRGIGWVFMDMTLEEKSKAGILEEQRSRGSIGRRLPSDDVREEAWIRKLEGTGKENILVVCGYLHLQALVAKLKARGHATSQRVYLESVPEILPQGTPLPVQ